MASSSEKTSYTQGTLNANAAFVSVLLYTSATFALSASEMVTSEAFVLFDNLLSTPVFTAAFASSATTACVAYLPMVPFTVNLL